MVYLIKLDCDRYKLLCTYHNVFLCLHNQSILTIDDFILTIFEKLYISYLMTCITIIQSNICIMSTQKIMSAKRIYSNFIYLLPYTYNYFKDMDISMLMIGYMQKKITNKNDLG